MVHAVLTMITMARALIFLAGLYPAVAFGGTSVAYPQTAFVYATQSGIIRRIIVPGPGETTNQTVGTGETLVVLPQGSANDQKSLEASIALLIGKPVASSDCLLVGGDKIVAAMASCDPALDTIPGFTIVQNPKALPGDTWVSGTAFTRQFAVVNKNAAARRLTVDQIVTLPIDNPVSPIPGDILAPAGAHHVGEVIDLPIQATQ